MSWATTFNSGNMGNNLSNKMANIKLDTTVDTAEIQAKINEHFKPVQTTGQTTNVQNNSQMQPQTTFNGGIQQDAFVQNGQMAQNQTFVPYQLQAPNYQTIPNNAGTQYVGPMQYYNPSYQNVQTYYPQNSGYMAQAPQYQPVQNVQTYQPQQVETAYSQNAVETASGVGQKLNTNSATYVPNFNGLSEGSFEKLQTSYIEAKASQGLISKGIDTIKSLFSMKGTSKSAKKAIENYQNGAISYNEAMKEIENFEEKSKTSTDSITSAISAIGAFAGASIMKAKGGTTAKMFALAVGLGAGIKTLMGIGERGTNQVAGDTLDATKLAKDLAQGSINGAITGGVSIVSAKPSMVSTTSSGALTGAISGSLMGVSDYSINCIDENKEFSINDMIIQSLKYAVGGLMLGAGTGAITGKLLNKKGAEQIAAGTKEMAQTKNLPLSYENIGKTMKTNSSGNYTGDEVIEDCTEALNKAMKLEKDSEIISLYEQFTKAGTAKEKSDLLNKLYKKLAVKYHPDTTTVQNAQDAMKLYTEIFGAKGNVGGKKALLYYYGELAKQAAA